MYRDEFKDNQREFYWTVPRALLAVLVLMVCGAGIGFLAQGTDFFMYKFFAPRQEAVRRQVYEHTKSFKQGNTQRLNTLCTQVATTDADHRALINDVIAQEFAEWNSDDVPDYLRGCLSRARER